MRRMLVLAGGVVLVAAVAATAFADAGRWSRGPGFEHRDGGRFGPVMMLERFDADGDGTLTLEEFEPLWVEFNRPRMVDRFQRLDADGDGKVTAEEMERPVQAMFAWGDRDGDGALSPQDMRRR